MRREYLLAVALSAAGCAVGPDFQRPDPPPIDKYLAGAPPAQTVEAGGTSQVFDAQRALQPDWWRLFGSDSLDALIARGLEQSPSLEAAEATLRASEYELRAGYGIFFPQVSGGVSADREQYNPLRVGVAGPSSTFNLFTVSASVSYALDIYGGQRRAVEKLGAETEAQRYALIGARIMLASNLANGAIAAAGYRAQLAATEELLASENEQLKVTQVQAQSGTQPYANVLSMQSLIASTEASLPALQQKIDQSTHLLATLSGQAPSQWTGTAPRLEELVLPHDLPLSVPSELVRQRPDILSAEAALHASSANIGVATAAMFPSLTLNAGYGVNNTALGTLFSGQSAFWSLGAGLAGPLFDGGTLWFQRKAAIESYRQSAANYRETVLSAFEQVADDLRALEHDAQGLEAQTRAVSAAEEALRLVQVGYQSGISTYLQVLTADEQLQQARIAAIQLQAQRLQDTVALYAALGGGWWNAPAASAAQGKPR